VEKYLHDCTTVLVIPDGALTGVPWSALPGKEAGSYLLGKYAIGTAGYGQQLMELLTRAPAQGDTLLAVGGVQYDAPRLAPRPGALAHRGPAQEGGKPTKWTFLPGTREEANAIAKLWKGGKPPLLMEGKDAHEAAVRDQLPHARYVHLATHAFFADPQVPSAFRYDLTREKLVMAGLEMTGRRSTVTGRNPLILSGVVLAGANVPQPHDEYGAPVGDDGILTAEEVVDLDLGGTELVVLSACETGRGDVAGGEGVFGLQRAFGMAGARTVVASLWQVDDRATQALMTEFYRNLWEKKLGKLEALRQAQLTMLRRYDLHAGQLRGQKVVPTDNPLPHDKARPWRNLPPFYWAAFVLSGDWR
jgi:CHAT domain-containing protein